MKTFVRATCGCVLLLASCVFCWGQDEAQPVKATLCNLYQHPEQYAGKMVEVRGGSVGGLSIEDLRHDSQQLPCPTFMRIVVVFPDQVKPVPGFHLIRNESYQKLAEALHYPGPIKIDATFEGRLDVAFAWRDHKRIKLGQDEEKGYGKKHEYDARIVLHQVSEVWVKPLPRR